MVFHSHSYLYDLVNTSENDDINFVQLVIEIPQETGGIFYWCQHLPPHFHDIHRDYNWFARLHCSPTSSRFKFLAPNGPFFGVSSSWEILKSRLFFGTNTSCENPEGLIMESIAAPKSYLVDRLEGCYAFQSVLNPVSPRQVSKGTLLHRSALLVSAVQHSTTTAG